MQIGPLLVAPLLTKKEYYLRPLDWVRVTLTILLF